MDEKAQALREWLAHDDQDVAFQKERLRITVVEIVLYSWRFLPLTHARLRRLKQ